MNLQCTIVGIRTIVVVLASLVVGGTAAAQPPADETETPASGASETTVELNSDGDEPLADPVAEFQRQYAAWQANRDAILRQLETIRELPIGERRKVGRRTQQSGDLAVAKVLAAAETAYVAEPTNKEVENYLLVVAVKSLQNNLIEDAARISILLLEHGFDPKILASVAGRSSLELGDVDNAIKYLTLAEESGVTLSRVSSGYLKSIDKFRSVLDGEMQLRAQEAEADDLPRVLLQTTRGDIVIELFENELPNAVANFIFLVEQNFYNDMAFFQVRPSYFSASGCPNDNGTGTAGYTILKEAYHNLFTNIESLRPAEAWDEEAMYRGHERHHTRGTVSMLALDPWTFGSQFMICQRFSTMTSADATHMAVGRVIQGMDIATKLMTINPRLAPKNVETDRLIRATVIRKRDHLYRPKTKDEVIHATAEYALELAKQGRPDEALEICKIVFETASKNPTLLYAGASCYLDKKDYNMAAKLLEKAVHISPDDPMPRRALARAYMQLKRVRDATSQLRELTRITPDDAVAFNNLGTLLMRQRRKREAIEALTKALELDPDYKQARRNLELLQ